MADMANNVYKMLKENGLIYEVYMYPKVDNVVVVYIEDGDWKHDHGYCKLLMEQKGFMHVMEKVTDECGDDCYSAEHYFLAKHDPMTEGLVKEC